MPLFQSRESRKAKALAELAFANPFLERRTELEGVVLGAAGRRPPMYRRFGLTLDDAFPDLPKLGAEAEKLVTTARQRLVEGRAASDAELRLYQDVSFYWLYNKYAVRLEVGQRVSAERWGRFREDFRFFLDVPQRHFGRQDDPAHVLAICVQIWGAFRRVFDCILGASTPATELRGAVWQSIFTRDLRRYGTALFRTLPDVPTLITGPSGTGKELVAKAIALSRYVPFDPQSQGLEPLDQPRLWSVNLSALPSTLVESALFGHKEGAFTDAQERKGLLEECGRLGTVFLDEIGELAPEIQVKLLRVIQERRFQRLGENTDRRFVGQIVTATNRDLAKEMREGRFREDLYYRLCGDIVTTPSLRKQLDDRPEDLPTFVRFIVRQLLPSDDAQRESVSDEVVSLSAEKPPSPERPDEEVDSLSDEVVSLIDEKLPPDYAWPGNFRELEQCVRNLLIRGDYRPPTASEDKGDSFDDQLIARGFSWDELLRYYCALVHKRKRTYKAAAEFLKIDWRTVRDKVVDGA